MRLHTRDFTVRLAAATARSISAAVPVGSELMPAEGAEADDSKLLSSDDVSELLACPGDREGKIDVLPALDGAVHEHVREAAAADPKQR